MIASRCGNAACPVEPARLDRFPGFCYRTSPRMAQMLSGAGGRLAQLVEQVTLNHRVASSSLASPSIFSRIALPAAIVGG